MTTFDKYLQIANKSWDVKYINMFLYNLDKNWDWDILIENPNMIEDLGNKLYETVKDTYSLKKVTKDRAEFLKSIINNKIK
jgi:hypothetical protein